RTCPHSLKRLGACSQIIRLSYSFLVCERHGPSQTISKVYRFLATVQLQHPQVDLSPNMFPLTHPNQLMLARALTEPIVPVAMVQMALADLQVQSSIPTS